MTKSERVPATADPIGVPQDVLNAFLDCPGSLEASLLAAVRAQNAALMAENERLRSALRQITRLKAEDMYMADDNDNMAAYIARAALGDQP